MVSCGISDSGSSQKNNSALREVNQNDRNQETENLFQDKQSGILGSNPAADSFSGGDAQPDNRSVNLEVKNELENLDSGKIKKHGHDGLDGRSDDAFDRSLSVPFHGRLFDSFSSERLPEVAQSARIASPANQASFDAGKLSLSHVQNEQENNQSATCAKSPEVEETPNRLTGRELAEWAMANYAVDPIQNSKNRWRIRLRCRKSGCQHSDHLHLKTISFMSDSVFKKLTRSERKYELWKKAVLAENAGTLRKSERSRPSADCASGDQGIS